MVSIPFQGLYDITGWAEESLPTQKNIVFQDTVKSDGSCFLAMPLVLFGKAKKNVLCVGFEQSVVHYMSICRKLGLNLAELQRNGCFSFIDCVSVPFQDSPNFTSLNVLSPSPSPEIPAVHTFSACTADSAAVSQSLRETVIVVDGLNSLRSWCSQEDVANFVHMLRTLISGKMPVSLFTMVHGDVADDTSLVRNVCHDADMILFIDALETGYSRDVHGQVSIIRSKIVKPSDVVRLHYRFTENNALFFSPGSVHVQ